MAAILNLGITAAAAAVVTPVLQLRPGPGGRGLPTNMLAQANFAYGSGGTSVDAWLQTSIDGGSSWIDVANFHADGAQAVFAANLLEIR